MGDNKKHKILVIDDEYDLGLLIKDFADDLGYLCWIATDTDSGLKIVSEERPEVVFMDVVIPQAGGIECLKRIKALYPETIVIMITGMQDEGLAKQSIQAGAYDYITKPFELEHLETQFLSRIFPQ